MLYAFQKCKHQLFSSTRLISIKFSNVSGLFGGPCILTLKFPDFSSRVTSHPGHFDPHIIFCILRLRKFVQVKNFCVMSKGDNQADDCNKCKCFVCVCIITKIEHLGWFSGVTRKNA